MSEKLTWWECVECGARVVGKNGNEKESPTGHYCGHRGCQSKAWKLIDIERERFQLSAIRAQLEEARKNADVYKGNMNFETNRANQAEQERDSLKQRCAELEASRERMRRELTELAAVVRGECPSLLNEDSGGDAKLDMAINAVLSEPPPQSLEAYCKEWAREKLAVVVRTLEDAIPQAYDAACGTEQDSSWIKAMPISRADVATRARNAHDLIQEALAALKELIE